MKIFFKPISRKNVISEFLREIGLKNHQTFDINVAQNHIPLRLGTM